MTLQFHVTVRNAMLDAWETQIGTSPTLKIRTGARPAAITDPSTGTVLSTVALPSDFMAAASAGVKDMSGTWQDNSADASGTAEHFEIVDSGGTVRVRGTVTATGGGGDLTVNNVVFASGQTFSITQFRLTAGNQ